MTASPEPSQIRVLLLDLEGTTTPPEFFTRKLLPYARERFEEFLARHGRELGVREDLEGLRKQHATGVAATLDPPPWLAGTPEAELASASAYSRWLMDGGNKCAALESLEGKIWSEGYYLGDLRGEVYPDVPPAFARWSQAGKQICIFSSSSVVAQRKLFATTSAGNLTPFIQGNFDSAVGAKSDPQSYRRIADFLMVPPRQILFLSAGVEELDAAGRAGTRTALCQREEASERPDERHWVIRSLEEVLPLP